MAYQEIIDKYYPAGSRLRDIYIRHCRAVADLALDIAKGKNLDISFCEIEEAAMLHDIGIFLTDATGIGCHGKEPYILHGILGAKILRTEGFDEKYARVSERHTGTGITNEDIVNQSLPLPLTGSYMPETTLERLICYADKFYSKSGDMQRKPIELVIKSMERISPSSLQRFRLLQEEFGV